jgi:hypothetical protein
MDVLDDLGNNECRSRMARVTDNEDFRASRSSDRIIPLYLALCPNLNWFYFFDRRNCLGSQRVVFYLLSLKPTLHDNTVAQPPRRSEFINERSVE